MPLSHSPHYPTASIQTYNLNLHMHIQVHAADKGALETWTVLEQLCSGYVLDLLVIPGQRGHMRSVL